MASLAPFLIRRGAVYHLRVRIPADLVAVVGMAEYKRSLKTACPKTARKRAARAQALVGLQPFDDLCSVRHAQRVRVGALEPGNMSKLDGNISRTDVVGWAGKFRPQRRFSAGDRVHNGSDDIGQIIRTIRHAPRFGMNDPRQHFGWNPVSPGHLVRIWLGRSLGRA